MGRSEVTTNVNGGDGGAQARGAERDRGGEEHGESEGVGQGAASRLEGLRGERRARQREAGASAAGVVLWFASAFWQG